MLRLPTFDYRAVKSVAEASTILAGEGADARLVAGGTDLWPNMKRRNQQARVVVGLKRVQALHGISGSPGKGLRIAAMTSLTDVCHDATVVAAYPGLARAVGSISTPVLRNMGTLGGNLCLDTRCTYYDQSEHWRQSIAFCMKAQGETCWVAPGSPRCWAVSSTDAAPLLCALGAEVELATDAGQRRIPLTDLYIDDGIAYLSKLPEEVLVAVHLPPAGELRSTYWKLRRRGSIDFPVLGVGAAIATDPAGRVTRAAIYLSGVGSRPIFAEASSQFLVGKPLTEETIARAAGQAREPSTPLDNTDFTLGWRKQMITQYVEGALLELAGLPPKARPPEHGRDPG